MLHSHLIWLFHNKSSSSHSLYKYIFLLDFIFITFFFTTFWMFVVVQKLFALIFFFKEIKQLFIQAIKSIKKFHFFFGCISSSTAYSDGSCAWESSKKKSEIESFHSIFWGRIIFVKNDGYFRKSNYIYREKWKIDESFEVFHLLFHELFEIFQSDYYSNYVWSFDKLFKWLLWCQVYKIP